MKQIFLVLLLLSVSYGCGKKSDSYQVFGSIPNKYGYSDLLIVKNGHELIIHTQTTAKGARGEGGEEFTITTEEEKITSACWGSGDNPDIFYTIQGQVRKIYRKPDGRFEDPTLLIR